MIIKPCPKHQTVSINETINTTEYIAAIKTLTDQSVQKPTQKNDNYNQSIATKTLQADKLSPIESKNSCIYCLKNIEAEESQVEHPYPLIPQLKVIKTRQPLSISYKITASHAALNTNWFACLVIFQNQVNLNNPEALFQNLMQHIKQSDPSITYNITQLTYTEYDELSEIIQTYLGYSIHTLFNLINEPDTSAEELERPINIPELLNTIELDSANFLLHSIQTNMQYRNYVQHSTNGSWHFDTTGNSTNPTEEPSNDLIALLKPATPTQRQITEAMEYSPLNEEQIIIDALNEVPPLPKDIPDDLHDCNAKIKLPKVFYKLLQNNLLNSNTQQLTFPLIHTYEAQPSSSYLPKTAPQPLNDQSKTNEQTVQHGSQTQVLTSTEELYFPQAQALTPQALPLFQPQAFEPIPPYQPQNFEQVAASTPQAQLSNLATSPKEQDHALTTTYNTQTQALAPQALPLFQPQAVEQIPPYQPQGFEQIAASTPQAEVSNLAISPNKQFQVQETASTPAIQKSSSQPSLVTAETTQLLISIPISFHKKAISPNTKSATAQSKLKKESSSLPEVPLTKKIKKEVEVTKNAANNNKNPQHILSTEVLTQSLVQLNAIETNNLASSSLKRINQFTLNQGANNTETLTQSLMKLNAIETKSQASSSLRRLNQLTLSQDTNNRVNILSPNAHHPLKILANGQITWKEIEEAVKELLNQPYEIPTHEAKTLYTVAVIPAAEYNNTLIRENLSEYYKSCEITIVSINEEDYRAWEQTIDSYSKEKSSELLKQFTNYFLPSFNTKTTKKNFHRASLAMNERATLREQWFLYTGIKFFIYLFRSLRLNAIANIRSIENDLKIIKLLSQAVIAREPSIAIANKGYISAWPDTFFTSTSNNNKKTHKINDFIVKLTPSTPVNLEISSLSSTSTTKKQEASNSRSYHPHDPNRLRDMLMPIVYSKSTHFPSLTVSTDCNSGESEVSLPLASLPLSSSTSTSSPLRPTIIDKPLSSIQYECITNKLSFNPKIRLIETKRRETIRFYDGHISCEGFIHGIIKLSHNTATPISTIDNKLILPCLLPCNSINREQRFTDLDYTYTKAKMILVEINPNDYLTLGSFFNTEKVDSTEALINVLQTFLPNINIPTTEDDNAIELLLQSLTIEQKKFVKEQWQLFLGTKILLLAYKRFVFNSTKVTANLNFSTSEDVSKIIKGMELEIIIKDLETKDQLNFSSYIKTFTNCFMKKEQFQYVSQVILDWKINS